MNQENSNYSRLSFCELINLNEHGARMELYERCRAMVVAYCKNWPSARNLEDDICQRVVLNILKKAESYTLPVADRHLCNLIYRMTSCQVKDLNRAAMQKGFDNKRGSCVVQRFSEIDGPSDDFGKKSKGKRCSVEEDVAWYRYQSRRKNTPEHDTDRDENDSSLVKRTRQRDVINSVLEKKSAKVRSAFLCSFNGNASIREVAREFGMTPNHLSKVRGSVKRQIVEAYEKEEAKG